MCLKSGCKRKIFAPKMEEVTEGWRKLHTEELHNFQSTSDIIMVIRLKGM
jgi:hypothetical protein